MKFYHHTARIFVGLKLGILADLGPLEILTPWWQNFKKYIYFKIWVLVMKYMESSCHLEVWNYDFYAKTVSTGILTTYRTTQTLEGMRDLKACLKIGIFSLFIMNLT